eukprot:TRINITY_DN9304_c0_g1_i1.p1 TRINITY_DN9304_c0_g1~~TRINITY_DN9304_c0_g1_i1.p1  ORF type:complete len:382 (-),score=99.91 TRINITY_DN9304_c0_g1_i1:21-1166(-)
MPRLVRTATILLAAWVATPAWGKKLVQGSCGASDDAEAVAAADAKIIKANSEEPAPPQIETRHMVLISPSSPLQAGNVATEAFASLPKVVTEDGFPVAEFTKYVVVGFSKADGPTGIILGDDVCGGAGFADDDAAMFFRANVPKKLGFLAPRLLNCLKDGECAAERSPDNFAAQMPFLQAITKGKLAGNMLPVVMQSQTADLGAALGEALALLVGPSGIWEGERVLFVFGSDLSSGLPADIAKDCDEATSKLIVESSAAQLARFFRKLKAGTAGAWCSSDNALPAGRGSVVAARRLAEQLSLTTTRTQVSNSASERWAAAQQGATAAAAAAPAPAPSALATAEPSAEKVDGFASILFWKDAGSVNERVAATAPAGFLQQNH